MTNAMRKRQYLIGKKFGRLKVISEAPSRTYPCGQSPRRSVCRCDCGKIIEVSNSHLTTGQIQSCKCLRREIVTAACFVHGHTPWGKPQSRTYQCWSKMISRCIHPSQHGFKNYGGRGISVCQRWMSFVNFLSDMGDKPEGKTIERINNNGNYEPGNCRWATQKEQQRNRRNNRILTVCGITACLAALCEHFGLYSSLVQNRLKSGWTVYNAFTTPILRPQSGRAKTPRQPAASSCPCR